MQQVYGFSAKKYGRRGSSKRYVLRKLFFKVGIVCDPCALARIAPEPWQKSQN